MRFYGMSLEEVMGLTLRAMRALMKQIGKITKLEAGTTDEGEEDKKVIGATGNVGFNIARRVFRKGTPRNA